MDGRKDAWNGAWSGKRERVLKRNRKRNVGLCSSSSSSGSSSVHASDSERKLMQLLCVPLCAPLVRLLPKPCVADAPLQKAARKAKGIYRKTREFSSLFVRFPVKRKHGRENPGEKEERRVNAATDSCHRRSSSISVPGCACVSLSYFPLLSLSLKGAAIPYTFPYSESTDDLFFSVAGPSGCCCRTQLLSLVSGTCSRVLCSSHYCVHARE